MTSEPLLAFVVDEVIQKLGDICVALNVSIHECSHIFSLESEGTSWLEARYPWLPILLCSGV